MSELPFAMACAVVQARYGPSTCILLVYVTGDANPAETAWVDQHLKTCRRCVRHVARMREQLLTLDTYAEFEQLARILDPSRACPLASAYLVNEWRLIMLFVDTACNVVTDPRLSRWFLAHVANCDCCQRKLAMVKRSPFIHRYRRLSAGTPHPN